MVGIVILNYNNIEDTCACVDSIFKHCDPSQFKINLVDNNSKQQVKDFIREYCRSNYSSYFNVIEDVENNVVLKKLNYVTSSKNEGYAKGNNIGVSLFSKDTDINYILILNNDIILTMDILLPLKKYLCENPMCGVVSSLLYDKNGNICYECARKEKGLLDLLVRSTILGKIPCFDKKTYENYILYDNKELLQDDVVPIALPSGSCMMFRKEVFEEIGRFDPNTFLYFEEDILWSKLKQRGYSSAMLPKVACIHLGAMSTSKANSSVIREAYLNSLWYYVNKYSNVPKLLYPIILLHLTLSKIKAYYKNRKYE